MSYGAWAFLLGEVGASFSIMMLKFPKRMIFMGPNGLILFFLFMVPVFVLTGIALLWRKRRIVFWLLVKQ
ncbi:hypothetical protein CEW92_13040 [Bacillaceae bacterium SAS-127]|nr:hypothetical protein CEW92_13040 [Bacillaceae bacterium SAS-127]